MKADDHFISSMIARMAGAADNRSIFILQILMNEKSPDRKRRTIDDTATLPSNKRPQTIEPSISSTLQSLTVSAHPSTIQYAHPPTSNTTKSQTKPYYTNIPDTSSETAEEDLLNSSKQGSLRILITSKEGICCFSYFSAGVVIGKQGKHIAEIREKTGTRVSISGQTQGAVERICTLEGQLKYDALNFRIVLWAQPCI